MGAGGGIVKGGGNAARVGLRTTGGVVTTSLAGGGGGGGGSAAASREPPRTRRWKCLRSSARATAMDMHMAVAAAGDELRARAGEGRQLDRKKAAIVSWFYA